MLEMQDQVVSRVLNPVKLAADEAMNAADVETTEHVSGGGNGWDLKVAVSSDDV